MAIAGKPGLALLLQHGSQTSLHAERSFLGGLKSLDVAPDAPVPLALNLDAAGISQLVGLLQNDQLQACSGEDALLLRPYELRKTKDHQLSVDWLADLASHAGTPGGIFLSSPLLNSRGRHDSEAAARAFARRHRLQLVTDADITTSRIDQKNLLEPTGIMDVQLLAGRFKLNSFYSAIDGRYHWAFVKGEFHAGQTPLIRIESECLTGHVFGSLLCDCGQQLEQGLAKIEASGCGALIYLRQEGRGIGLVGKIRAYKLQQSRALDTVDANLALGMPEDARDYVIGAQIIRHFGIRRLHLLTNNPRKVRGLEAYGLEVVKRVPHVIAPTAHNQKYLATKKSRMGHLI